MTGEFNRALKKLRVKKDEVGSLEEERKLATRATQDKLDRVIKNWEEDPKRRKKLKKVSKEFKEILAEVKDDFFHGEATIEGGELYPYATYTETVLKAYGGRITLKMGTQLEEKEGGVNKLFGNNTTIENLESIDVNTINLIAGPVDFETDIRESSWRTDVQNKILEALQTYDEWSRASGSGTPDRVSSIPVDSRGDPLSGSS